MAVIFVIRQIAKQTCQKYRMEKKRLMKTNKARHTLYLYRYIVTCSNRTGGHQRDNLTLREHKQYLLVIDQGEIVTLIKTNKNIQI